MTDLLLTATYFLIPFFLSGIKDYRHGLVTGLFICLASFGHIIPVLALIPLFASLCVFIISEKRQNLKAVVALQLHSPAFLMFMIFIISMSIFCASEAAFSLYEKLLGMHPAVIERGRRIGIVASLAGPLVIGGWCDRRGPFFAAITLTLLAELAVAFTAGGDTHISLYYAGCFFTCFCSSGFFVVVTILLYYFSGAAAFRKIYPLAAAVAFVSELCAKLYYRNIVAQSKTPDITGKLGSTQDFMISLLILTLCSAFFLFICWQRRFILVIDKNKDV